MGVQAFSEESRYWIIGCLVLFSIIDIIYGFILGFEQSLVEFCNIAPLFIAATVWTGRDEFVHFALIFGVLFQLPWTLDWVLRPLNLSFLHLYESYHKLPLSFKVLSFSQHLLNVPVAAWVIRKMEIRRLDWEQIGVGIGIVLGLATASYSYGFVVNANCVYYNCVDSLTPYLRGDPYTVSWVTTLCLIWIGYGRICHYVSAWLQGR